jgi:hypothetical protein
MEPPARVTLLRQPFTVDEVCDICRLEYETVVLGKWNIIKPYWYLFVRTVCIFRCGDVRYLGRPFARCNSQDTTRRGQPLF